MLRNINSIYKSLKKSIKNLPTRNLLQKFQQLTNLLMLFWSLQVMHLHSRRLALSHDIVACGVSDDGFNLNFLMNES